MATASAMTDVTDTSDASIRPFSVNIRNEELVDLRRRIDAARFPSKELVRTSRRASNWPPSRLSAAYWATDYDLHRVADRLNAFRTT